MPNNSSPASQSVSTVEFPCEEWLVTRTPQGEMVSVKPIPGTWTLVSAEDCRTFAERGLDVKALFSCPNCQQMGVIPSTFNPTKELGDAKLPSELHCKQCDFVCNVILKDWDKRRLYCACYETLTNVDDTVTTHKEYLHAENEAEARKFFWAQHSLVEMQNNKQVVLHLVGIAPAIGFFVPNPKDERILLV